MKQLPTWSFWCLVVRVSFQVLSLSHLVRRTTTSFALHVAPMQLLRDNCLDSVHYFTQFYFRSLVYLFWQLRMVQVMHRSLIYFLYELLIF